MDFKSKYPKILIVFLIVLIFVMGIWMIFSVKPSMLPRWLLKFIYT